MLPFPIIENQRKRRFPFSNIYSENDTETYTESLLYICKENIMKNNR